ncbi:MAG: serine hydrolase domain-containing protein [Bacteroidota bacterium]
MQTRLVVLFIVLAASSACAQPQVSGDIGAALDAYLTNQVSPGFSGAVLAAKNGDVVLRKGYGYADQEAGVPNTPETVFQIGSVTKPLTAIAVMSLVDQGLVDLSASIAEYLEGIPDEHHDITVHHLLTHTAGFPGGIGDDYEAIGREAYIRLALATDLEREPGEAYEYSNVGFALAAAIVEVVTGGSYDAYLQRILGEVGIQHTGYRLDGGVFAHGYDGDEDLGYPFDRPWSEDGPYWHLRGNGGLLSTVDDLYALHQALEAGDLLSDSSLEAMHRPHTDEGEGSGSHYGYGWALFETPLGTLAAHNGGDPGFTADFLRFRDDNTVLILISNDRRVDATRLSESLMEVLFGGDPDPFRPGLLSPIAIEDLAELRMGRRALAFIEAINSRSDEAARAFAAEHLVDGFQRDMDRLVGFFDEVRDELGGAPFDLQRVGWDEQEGQMNLFTTLPDGRHYKAVLGFESDGEYRIAGLFTRFIDEAPGDLFE